jgi:hypothetical protein
MKKTLIGMFALTLLSTSALAGTDKKVKKSKAKTVCTKNCPETKDCKKTAKCPNRPGCVCN